MTWRGLGDDYRFSLDAFRDTVVNNRQKLPLLKRTVETWGSTAQRVRHRLATSGRIAHTDYAVVWEELDVFRFATIGFMIDANHPFVGAHFPSWMASDQPRLNDLRDRLHTENHKLLIEEHVYGFFWNPQRTTIEWLMDSGIALVKLAGSVAGVITTMGASLPSLISSVENIIELSGDLVKTFKEVQESAAPIIQAVGSVAESGRALSRAAAADPTTTDISRITGTTGYTSEEMRLLGLDVATRRRLSADRQVIQGFFSSREETDQERDLRLRTELEAQLAEISKIMFVVVQQATPVRLHYEVKDVRGQDILCDFTINAATRSMLRIGQTDLAKYTRKIAYLDQGSTGTEILINPWLIEGDTGYQQAARFREDGYAMNASYPLSGPPLYNQSAPDLWEEIRRLENKTVPLPEGVLRARRHLEGRMQQKKIELRNRANQLIQQAALRFQVRQRERQLDALRRQQETMERLAAAYRVFIAEFFPPPLNQTELAPHPQPPSRDGQAKALCHRAIAFILNQSRDKLPSADAFIESTQIRRVGGLFTARRDNPALLPLDLHLRTWESKIAAQKAQPEAMDFLGECVAVLESITSQCRRFIREKEEKEPDPRRQSQRVPHVRELERKALAQADALVNVSEGYARLLAEMAEA